jgi:hypothetical protein
MTFIIIKTPKTPIPPLPWPGLYFYAENGPVSSEIVHISLTVFKPCVIVEVIQFGMRGAGAARG